LISTGFGGVKGVFLIKIESLQFLVQITMEKINQNNCKFRKKFGRSRHFVGPQKLDTELKNSVIPNFSKRPSFRTPEKTWSFWKKLKHPKALSRWLRKLYWTFSSTCIFSHSNCSVRLFLVQTFSRELENENPKSSVFFSEKINVSFLQSAAKKN